MKVRVLYKDNGSVAVIHPAPKSRRKDESEVDWLNRVLGKATPEGIDFEDMDDSQLPSREDRNAWTKKQGGGVKVNTVKAKAIKDEVKRQDLIEKEKTKLAEASLKAKGLI